MIVNFAPGYLVHSINEKKTEASKACEEFMFVVKEVPSKKRYLKILFLMDLERNAA